MKKAKEKIILMLLKHILKRASSDKIPRSGNEGERVNCYTAIAYKDHEGLIIRHYSEGYLVCLKHDGRKYSIQTKITFREGANKRGNSSRLTQSFHFFMFEPIFSPVNALNQPI
ncbi:hypothetical protein ACLHZ5_18930 [Aeromonas media]|uniref:hypothetical protein n=1 Tax=Aeromonas media TaxID=651 RepID=UPI003D086221